MFKPSVLVLAVLLSSTAFWSAFVEGSMSVTTALIRFLIAVPVAAVMRLVLIAVTGIYHKPVAEPTPPPTGQDELLDQLNG